jgi:hypothetical protein
MNAVQTLHRSVTRAARRPALAVLAAAAAVLMLPWSCKSPTSPDGAGEADIVITSHWSEQVDVFMDGTFKFSLGYKETAEIDNVPRKSHLMEAKSQVTGEVVAQTTLEVTSKTKYDWIIEHRARINVWNSLDKTVSVFMDGVFQFDLADRENRYLIDVPLGDHLLAAFRKIDGKQVSSITMKVTENKDYEWLIRIL